MSFDVRITRPALEDAHEIYAWIESHGAPLNARRWYRDLLEAIGTLSEFAERCPLAPENAEVRGASIRHLIRGDYRVIYAVRDERVAVLHIRHGSRHPGSTADLRNLLEAREKVAKGLERDRVGPVVDSDEAENKALKKPKKRRSERDT